jgi:hypothetical protein
MDPVTMVVIPGFLGGLVIALFVILANRRSARKPAMILPYRLEHVSPHMINMASIKVAGVGGLGLVAMAVAVALDVPEIGQSIGIGLGLGTIAAVFMIVRARRNGPMPSSGQRPGANTTLSIDDPFATGEESQRDVRGPGDVSFVSAS